MLAQAQDHVAGLEAGLGRGAVVGQGGDGDAAAARERGGLGRWYVGDF